MSRNSKTRREKNKVLSVQLSDSKRKQNKEIVDKNIDIITDLFPTASRKDVSHILSVKGIEM
jgi:hypothetical protein